MLSRDLSKAFKGRELAHVPLFGGGSAVAGLSRIGPRDRYDWDGLKRQKPTSQPKVLLQTTISGWGLFETGGLIQKVSGGSAFLARIPSAHRYYRDPACKSWEFFWLMIEQPEALARLERHPNLGNILLPIQAHPRLIASAVSTCLSICLEHDDFRVEEAIFSLVFELERFAFDLTHPREPRQKLLEAVRRTVLNHLTHPLNVDEVAEIHGMSRSNFAHCFQRITGLAPASYMRDLRLNEATRLLRQGHGSIKEVAAATGFANANHFRKCFRQRFLVSPSDYLASPASASRNVR
jgi:AraC-like DNA-binding protein